MVGETDKGRWGRGENVGCTEYRRLSRETFDLLEFKSSESELDHPDDDVNNKERDAKLKHLMERRETLQPVSHLLERHFLVTAISWLFLIFKITSWEITLKKNTVRFNYVFERLVDSRPYTSDCWVHNKHTSFKLPLFAFTLKACKHAFCCFLTCINNGIESQVLVVNDCSSYFSDTKFVFCSGVGRKEGEKQGKEWI